MSQIAPPYSYAYIQNEGPGTSIRLEVWSVVEFRDKKLWDAEASGSEENPKKSGFQISCILQDGAKKNLRRKKFMIDLLQNVLCSPFFKEADAHLSN